MKHNNVIAGMIVALVAAFAIAACGSSSSGKSGHASEWTKQNISESEGQLSALDESQRKCVVAAIAAKYSPAEAKTGSPTSSQRAETEAITKRCLGASSSSSSSSSSPSNGWTSAEKSHLLEECSTGVESGGSTQECDCALKWLEAHLSPSQLINAAAEGNYVKEGSELLAACPGVKGTGVLGQ